MDGSVVVSVVLSGGSVVTMVESVISSVVAGNPVVVSTFCTVVLSVSAVVAGSVVIVLVGFFVVVEASIIHCSSHSISISLLQYSPGGHSCGSPKVMVWFPTSTHW